MTFYTNPNNMFPIFYLISSVMVSLNNSCAFTNLTVFWLDYFSRNNQSLNIFESASIAIFLCLVFLVKLSLFVKYFIFISGVIFYINRIVTFSIFYVPIGSPLDGKVSIFNVPIVFVFLNSHS